MKFETFDSGITPPFAADMILEVVDLEQFLSTDRSKRARLIWCDDVNISHIKGTAEEWSYRVRVNHDAFRDLRSLTSKDCLIVTEP